MAVGCETAVEQYHSAVWNMEAVGGRSSVVRALAAQASDLGSIPGGSPVLFYIPFSACVCSINILYIAGRKAGAKNLMMVIFSLIPRGYVI